jgi:hypothetical protein
MTALNLANIPSGINSYERLMMWCTQALQSTTNGLQVTAVIGEGPAPAASVQIAKIADNTDRAICVVYLPIDFPALNSPTAKTCMDAQDMAEDSPHSNLISN